MPVSILNGETGLSVRTKLNSLLLTVDGLVNVKAFGAVGDNVADDTAAIKAALAYAVTNGIAGVKIPSGRYKITDMIQLGDGLAFRSVALVGDYSTSFEGVTHGTRLFPTFTDRPVINIQGTTNAVVRGISIRGLNYSFVQNLSTPWRLSNRTDWLGPGMSAALNRYSPYAAIALDAFCGSAPSNPYAGGTYGNPYASTNPSIEHCDISGFGVGFVGHPSTHDSNGDFIRITNTSISNCVNAIAVCHTQSRNVAIENLKYALCHSAITNDYYGPQNGKFGGVVDNCSGGISYQFMDIGSATQFGAMTFKGLYFERQGRIGVYGKSNAPFPCPIKFESCTFNLDETAVASSPAGLIEVHGAPQITFERCVFQEYLRMINLVQGGRPYVKVVECQSLGPADAVTVATARAFSFFGGLGVGVADLSDGTLVADSNQLISYDEGTTTSRVRVFGPTVDTQTPRRVVHQTAERFIDAYGRSYSIKDKRVRFPIDPTNTGYITVPFATVNDSLTFRYHKALQEALSVNASAISAGDLLHFSQFGTWAGVTAVAVNADTHYDVTAKLMTNFSVSGGVYTSNDNLAATTGTVWLYHTGQYVGADVWYGDFTSGSPTVANVHRGDGYGGNIADGIKVGDLLASPQVNDAFVGIPYDKGTKVITVTNGSPGSITLSKNATATKRFPISSVLFS